MTSDDTHTRTVELLESNSYFGMEPPQVKLLKQVCLNRFDWLLTSHGTKLIIVVEWLHSVLNLPLITGKGCMLG